MPFRARLVRATSPGARSPVRARSPAPPSCPSSACAPQTQVIGSKGVSALQRTHGNYISLSIDETYQGPITFSLASFLAEQVLATPADQYTILFNKFKSVITFDVTPITMKARPRPHPNAESRVQPHPEP